MTPEAQRPIRIQRRRSKGWRMPENTVYVGRPTQWGNPFKVFGDQTAALAVAKYRYEIIRMGGGIVGFNHLWVERHLRGKNLACWCSLDQPCHADVLLEIANV